MNEIHARALLSEVRGGATPGRIAHLTSPDIPDSATLVGVNGAHVRKALCPNGLRRIGGTTYVYQVWAAW